MRCDTRLFDLSLKPLVGAENLDLDRARGAGLHTCRGLPLVQLLMTHMALGDDTAVLVEDRHFVGAVPGTVLASDTDVVVMKDDAVVEFDIGVGRAASETFGVDAVVAAHRVEELADIGKDARFHLSDAPPLDVRTVVVLFVARHFTAVAPHTGGHVEVKAVLLSLLERWKVDLIISALHAGFGFVVDKALQRCFWLHSAPYSIIKMIR